MFGFDVAVLGKLLIAVLLGGVIGTERQIHGRPAGLRTHVLVCVGSTLIVLAGQALGPTVDPGRAVAGIVTGIGFLGAGVIIKSRDLVRGLTTAACIWYVAAVGIAVGEGLYAMAVMATVIAVTVLVLLGWLAHRMPTASYRTVIVRGAYQDAEVIEAACRNRLVSMNHRVIGASGRLDKAGGTAEYTFRVQTRVRLRGAEAARGLMAIPGVLDVVWD